MALALLSSFPTINTYTYSNIRRLSPSLSFSSNAVTTLHKSFSRRNSCNKAYAFRNCYNNRPFFHQPLDHHRIFSTKRTGLLLVPFNANKNSEPEGGGGAGAGAGGEGKGGEQDFKAMETVLRLYSAIKSKNVHELSDVISDECQCVCNFFSSGFQPFNGKKQVLDFFLRLIKSLGNHIEFVVTPTMQDGLNVGIKWRLEWKNINVPLGKGVSLHMCHVYHGKMVIRNLEMFLEPLLPVEPFRLRTIRYTTSIMEHLSSLLIFRNKPKRVAYILLSLFIMVALIIFFNLTTF
ncbi:uncharacterized protein LOC133794815 [Humulus lupulus]|uniref:uncharacterized protein LOC133794815 n=1 Tax=Humulus lupulus TaxID=3486 RepID=UPI002B417FCE|nr:uncharacterized protein LOC133794815 [Humulus lupulus]